MELTAFNGKFVKVNTVGGQTYNGKIKQIDRLGSVVLTKFDDVIVIPGNQVESLTFKETELPEEEK